MSKLAAGDCALILIDHQIISMSHIKTVPVEIAKQNNVALTKAARILGIPSVWTSSSEEANKDWWMPELKELEPESYANHIRRTGIIDSWDDPAFVRAVEATGRRTLIMAGTTNDGCLLYTALSAKQAGYEVHAVLDAGGSAFEISEYAARVRMNAAGVTLTATNTVLGELAYDWSTPAGGQLRQVLAETMTKNMGGFGLKK